MGTIKRITLGITFWLSYSLCFALNGNGSLDTKVLGGLNTAQTYLTYSMWAASVLGILAIGFMLFTNIQDAILKHLARGFAVIGVVAMAYFIPGWFGLCISF